MPQIFFNRLPKFRKRIGPILAQVPILKNFINEESTAGQTGETFSTYVP
jgi:hypothetical protein